VSFRMQGVGFTPPLFGASAWGFLKKEVNLELCGGIDRKTFSRMETSLSIHGGLSHPFKDYSL
jgi:hypothetical protein